ncbi:MAG: DUF2341 domain-containing protein [Chitinispirillaceae bacterium]|nr:DUF2341 domain-containing protein [Chitinispirillaceae bacterium]
MLQCGNLADLSGAGSETTNSLTGTVAMADGTPAAFAVVRLIPNSHDAVKSEPLPARLITTANKQGKYGFQRLDTGAYTILAHHTAGTTTAFITGIHAIGDTVTVEQIRLKEPGAISVVLPDNVDKSVGYLYIPGTTIFTFLNSQGELVTLESVPEGIMPAIAYSSTNSPVSTIIRYDVAVNSGDTAVVVNPGWKHAQRLVLNTSATGADVAGIVYGFPVLVRLTGANFDFSQAQTGGADLRYTKQDNTFLPIEIERWDSLDRTAEIWVNVDTVFGGNDSQYLTMYWGNPDASSTSSSTAVFDTAAGFQGVWHLNEYGNDIALDATANRYDGNAYHMSGASSTPGAIGNARAFDGDSSYITMPNTASGKLNFPEDGYFTVSAWVYADTADYVYRTIVAKGYQQYFLWITYIPSNKPLWEFGNFSETDNWHTSNTPVTEKQWMLLTGVRQGSAQYLYCNGELVADKSTIFSWGLSRDTSNDFTIGRFFKEATFPSNFGYCYFKGKIDEVSVSRGARSGDWIRLSYMNQRNDDKLVQFK